MRVKIKTRLGEEKLNNQECLMKIVEYNDNHDIVVEFQDNYKKRVKSTYYCFSNGQIKNPAFFNSRINEELYNYQGCLMKIIEYNDSKNIIVEFQDKYKAKINATYQRFLKGSIKNPYYPSVYNVGVIGVKYPRVTKGNKTTEYITWCGILSRCFDEKEKIKSPTYKDITCCNEWLLYENFYEWLHSQPNFDKWLNGDRWAIDKDILVKGNKVYSSDTCCLVSQNVNTLFVKKDKNRGNLPIGVCKHGNTFQSLCQNPFTKKQEYLGSYNTIEEAFLEYKNYKEKIIKQVAQIEFDNGNITKECYEAMMKYEVEITD